MKIKESEEKEMNNDYLRENERDEDENYHAMPNQDLNNYEEMINDTVNEDYEESVQNYQPTHQEVSEDYQEESPTYQQIYQEPSIEEDNSTNEEKKPINFEIEGTRYEAVLEKYDGSRNNHGKNVINNMKMDQSKGIKRGWSKINFNLNQGSRGYAVISSLTTIVAIAGIIIFYIVTKI